MNRISIINLTLIAVVVFALAFSFRLSDKRIELSYPAYWPKPVYNFNENPLDSTKIELGRTLFYDPILSANGTISCASCHLSFTAFTHVDHALSHGIHDSIGFRNSPVLINLAWNKHFMWDGAINHIEMQALAPISSPSEMGEEIGHVIQKLAESEIYSKMFEQAFGDTIISSQYLLKAMAQFQLTFVSANSKYDRVIQEIDTFSHQEKKGYELFKKNCASCHREPLFTTGEFANNGLPIDTFLMDFGRYRITKLSDDSLKFKIPTLRNIEFSFPYMHDGRFKSLYQVLGHYSDGIVSSPNLAKDLEKGIPLTSDQKVDIIAFLLTLTDKEFLFNSNFAFPKK